MASRGSKVYGLVASAEKGDKMEGEPSLSVTLTDVQVDSQVLSVQTQPISVKGEAGHGRRRLLGGAALGAGIGALADGGEGAAIGAGVGAVGAAAGSEKAAVIPAQTAQAFTLAVPPQVSVMTSVAVR